MTDKITVLYDTIRLEEKLLIKAAAVSYTHLRAHETSLHLVCRLLLEIPLEDEMERKIINDKKGRRERND